MESLIYSLNATVPIFAVIFFSALLRGRGFFSDGFLATADKLVFKILLPALLFRDIAAGRITETFDLRFFLFCALSTTVYFLVIWLGAELFLKDKTMVGAFVQGAFRGSLAVLGVAFVQNIYGHAGSVPLMIVATVPLYNIYSVIVLTVRSGAPAAQGGRLRQTLRGIVTNPIILGILAGLPFSLLSVDFPPLVSKTLDLLAAPATPLALISIGAGFEGRKALQKFRPTAAASLIKLVLLPVVFLPIAVWMGFRGEPLVALVIMLGAPSTVSGYIMSKNMQGDFVLSSSIVMATTALSSITMTVILFLLNWYTLI